jgi:hypothetical protein
MTAIPVFGKTKGDDAIHSALVELGVTASWHKFACKISTLSYKNVIHYILRSTSNGTGNQFPIITNDIIVEKDRFVNSHVDA